MNQRSVPAPSPGADMSWEVYTVFRDFNADRDSECQGCWWRHAEVPAV